MKLDLWHRFVADRKLKSTTTSPCRTTCFTGCENQGRCKQEMYAQSNNLSPFTPLLFNRLKNRKSYCKRLLHALVPVSWHNVASINIQQIPLETHAWTRVGLHLKCPFFLSGLNSNRKKKKNYRKILVKLCGIRFYESLSIGSRLTKGHT